MIVLALDTSLAAVQAAVADEAGVRAAISEPMERGHQERLAPMVAEAMTQAGVRPADLGRVVVACGPGSFTGLRVGLAFAKAFALARGVPCAGVGTLEALAASFPGDEVAAVIAAPHDRVYLQRFLSGEAVKGPLLLARAAAALAVGGARLVGPGAPILGGSEADAIGWPDVGALALAAARGAALGPTDPIYLREVGASTLAERRSAASAGA